MIAARQKVAIDKIPPSRKESRRSFRSDGSRTPDFAQSAFVIGNTLPLFRKASCSCGGGCPACQTESNDLKVSQPNDPAEIEADQIADRIMRMSIDDAKPKSNLSNTSNTIHRKCDACEDEEEEAAETPLMRKEAFASAAPTPPPDDTPLSIRNVLNSGGQPLDLQTRNFFEPRFGRDFSNVRVHTGSAAEQSARDVNANAYTVGHNVVFGARRFEPASYEGRRLIAHELTHVVQQSGVGGGRVEQSNKNQGPSTILAHIFQLKSNSVGLTVQRDEETKGKATDPFEESRKELAEIKKNWEEVKAAGSMFKATEEWIKRGNTVVFLIDQHMTAYINASKDGRSQLLDFYLKLLQSDKVMYDYIAWHVVVHVNLLGMKPDLSSLADSFKADNRAFTGRKEAEEYVRLLQKLTDVSLKRSDVELMEVLVSIKITAKSGDVILAETTATGAYSNQAFFEKETTQLIKVQGGIQTLAGELNTFLDNAFTEGLIQAGEAVIEFYSVRGGKRGGPKASKSKPKKGEKKQEKKQEKKEEKKDEKKEEKKEEKKGSGKWTCYGRSAVLQIPSALPDHKCQYDGQYVDGPSVSASSEAAACLAAKHAFNAMMPRGCRPKHLDCRCTKTR